MLNDIQIRQAKPGPKRRKLSDSGGLQLWIEPNGKKYWRWKYRLDDKQKDFAIGVYPAVSLKEARQARDDARRLLDTGKDPTESRRLDKINRQESAANTFDAIADELLQKKVREGKADKTLAKVEWFRRLASPALGARPIKEISPAEVLAVLRPIEQRGNAETAKKMRGFIGQVFRYAIATGRSETDPTIALRGALVAPRVTHRAAITEPKAFGGLLRAIAGYDGAFETRIALELLALTFVRPGELRAAEWREIDLDGAVWTIAAEKMKMRRPHRVPLASRAVVILRELASVKRRGPFLFPSVRSTSRCMSENTLNAALRRLGFDKGEMTSHGFRATASSMLNESRLWHPDAIERQLAHVEKNAVRRAYDRADHWDERVRMMTWWAERCEAMRLGQ